MIIDKNDIEKAKEKLGDQNAFLMADLLELDDFDERNLKACCPYHNENTASFIYNKKAHNWHCFGCNITECTYTSFTNKLTRDEPERNIGD